MPKWEPGYQGDSLVRVKYNLPVTFKMGEKEDGTPVYHTFETMEDADDFYLHAVAHINTCLSAGWQEKDGMDWTPYEDYFKTEA